MARFPFRRALAPLLAAGLIVMAGPGAAVPSPKASALIVKGQEAIARGDGLGAELHLKSALAAGAKRDDVAARMGEAFIYQGRRDKAREWLGPGQFTPGEAAHGFHLLGLLEHGEGHLAAAATAYDRAIALAPKSVSLWVNLGYLRYAQGNQLQALEAADRALELDPQHVRALEFKGQFVRDQFGLAAALPWFEAALESDPGDRSVLIEYAATLGDMGQASRMLEVTRELLRRDGRNARALLLQAQLAARAGDMSLARSLLNKAGNRLKDVPAKLLLDGIIELSSGNNLLAIEAFEKLVARQPTNAQAQTLLARSYYSAGNFKILVARFRPFALNGDASAEMLTLVARAHEELGQRDLAVPLLERAARSTDLPFMEIRENQPIGALLGASQLQEAERQAEQLRAGNPGSAALQAQAGDVQLALGRALPALERYRLAARVRMTESLLLRTVAALAMAGQGGEARFLVENYLVQNPSSRVAARLAAGHAAARGDWPRARQLLEYLRMAGGNDDVRLLADLSLAQLRSGDARAAEETARTAYRLQPSNGAAAKAWGMSLTAIKERPDDAKALLAKARALGA